MLYYVSGTVAVLEPGLAVIDCGGVGYGCRVTAYTASQLKLNQKAKLFVTESIREDAYDIYGFISREVLERAWHRAMAMASAASSGLGMAFKCRSRLVISCTWCLVALP